MELVDTNRYEGMLAPSATEGLVVGTEEATHCTVTVDRGERGSTPAPYHLFWRAHIDDGWEPQGRYYDMEADALAFALPETDQCRVGVSNESDGEARYRICLFSFRPFS